MLTGRFRPSLMSMTAFGLDTAISRIALGGARPLPHICGDQVAPDSGERNLSRASPAWPPMVRRRRHAVSGDQPPEPPCPLSPPSDLRARTDLTPGRPLPNIPDHDVGHRR